MQLVGPLDKQWEERASARRIPRAGESRAPRARHTDVVPDARAWLTRHERVADAAITLLVLLLMLQPLFQARGCDCEQLPAWGWGLVLAETLPLIWRRRFPFAVAFATGLLAGVHGASSVPDAPLSFPALVALYALAAHGTRRKALLGAGIAVVAIAVALIVDRSQADSQDVTVNYLVFATAWLLGDSARSRRERSVELEQRMAQAELTRTAEAGQAVAQERTRLAREMHDVLAHSVALMVVQAEAGPVVVHRDPDRASQAFEAISATGKQALTELRGLLGVLRAEADQSQQLSPQPGLAQLDPLIQRCREAGLEVRVSVHGDVRPLSTSADLAAYRVVQEALTNVVKHAGPARAEVVVRYDAEAVEVTVCDDGLGANEPAGTSQKGHGLVGMRERLAALGGELSAGPAGQRGWTTSGRLPLPRQSEPTR